MLGQATVQSDPFDHTTESTYDLRGNRIEVREQAADEQGNPVWLVTRTVYDAAGRAVVTTDPYVAGTSSPIFATETEYDDVGRVLVTRRRKGVIIDLTGSGAALQSSVTYAGTIVTSSGSTYDANGRVTVSTDSDNLETGYTYNRSGVTVQTRTESVDQTGQTVWLITRTIYDAHGRAVLTTDPYVEDSTAPILATQTVYDDQGRAYRSIRLQGVQVELLNGETSLANGGTELWQTRTVFDDRGRVAQTIAADGQITDFEYDALNRRVATIGSPVTLGGLMVRHRTETVYDDLGRVRSERTNLRRLADGTIDDSEVRATTYDYDASNHLIKTTFADQTTIEATYDAFGRKTSETNQLGKTRSFEYDAFGRLAVVLLPAVPDPDNHDAPTQPRYEYSYDAQGHQTLIRDPLGHETRFTYDSQGNQLTRTLPLGFGTDGKRGTADDTAVPTGDFTERFEYDDRGRQTLHVSFEGVVTQTLYDVATGRLSEQRFFPSKAAYANGAGTPSEAWTTTYDGFGRVVKVRQDRSGVLRDTTTTYDGQGRVTRVATPEGAVNHDYDDLGRLSRTYTTTTAGTDPIDDTHYGYDDLGRLASVTVYERNDVPFAPGSRETTTYGYDLVGNLQWQIRPDRVLVYYTYDALNRLDVLTHYAAGTSPQSPEFLDYVARYDYDLWADGRRKSVSETTMFDSSGWGYPEPHTTTTTWDYDALGRLIDESIDHYVNDLDRSEHFVYDLAGNRKSRTVDPGRDGATTPDEVTTYDYDANDRLKSETLDTDGVSPVEQTTTYGYDHTQQTSKSVSLSGTATAATTFLYDRQGRLSVATVTTYTGGTASRIERTTYSYGPDGIRTGALHEVDATADGTYETATRTEYLNDAANPTGYSQVVRETTTDVAAAQVQQTIVYTLGHDQVSQTTMLYVAGVPDTAATLVFGYDGHGSTRVLTELAGVIATVAGVRQLFDYDAYGNLLNMEVAHAATSLLYSGEMFDARIGQQYLRARWYDPSTGRFNRLDPFFGILQDPQSLHKYLYVSGDPIGGTDPTGLAEFTIPGINVTISINFSFHGVKTFADFTSFAALRSVQIAANFEQILFFMEFGIAALTFTAQLVLLGIDMIPDNYTNPNHGTNRPVEPYEVGEYDDLSRRAARNGQGGVLRMHHTPQKKLASEIIPGYPPPPSPKEPCMAIPVLEHTEISRAQQTHALDYFHTKPSREDLLVRDFFHIRKYTNAPVGQLKNLAGMIRGRYPSVFARFRPR